MGDAQPDRLYLIPGLSSAVGQGMSVAEYERFIMSPVEGIWELHDGVPVEKPGRTWAASEVVNELAFGLMRQLERAEFRVFFGLRVSLPPATIFVPDVLVVPTHYGDEFRNRPDVPAIFTHPVPLVAEVWSHPESGYDIDTKIPVYQQWGRPGSLAHSPLRAHVDVLGAASGRKV